MNNKLTGTQGLEHLANIFFNMPVKQQDEWTQLKLGVSSRTFRRWCERYNIKITKSVNLG